MLKTKADHRKAIALTTQIIVQQARVERHRRKSWNGRTAAVRQRAYLRAVGAQNGFDGAVHLLRKMLGA